MAMAVSRGVPSSLMEAVAQDPDRFVKTLRGNRNVVDFPSFVMELKRDMQSNNASRYVFLDLDKELLRILFNSKEVRSVITKNVGASEANRIYAQETQQSLPAIVSTGRMARTPFQERSRRRTPQSIPISRFSGAQISFLRLKKRQGLTPKEVISEFRKSFPQSSRTDKEVREQYFRG